MVSSFNTMIDNHIVSPLGITKETLGLIPDTHVLETKLSIIDELDEDKNPTSCLLLTHVNLAM